MKRSELKQIIKETIEESVAVTSKLAFKEESYSPESDDIDDKVQKEIEKLSSKIAKLILSSSIANGFEYSQDSLAFEVKTFINDISIF